MRPAWRAILCALLAPAVCVGIAHAQGYRLRLDTRAQSVGFRGVALDSIAAANVVTGPGGGNFTPDGFAVRCGAGASYCFYFRPGARQQAAPAVASLDLTLWGLGIAGLSLHSDARMALDLGDADVWPGTEPDFQLLEAWAEYTRSAFTGRLGRQVYTSRLGYTGFDGARVVLRGDRLGLDVGGYLGRGLARGVALPVTSGALNPLDDFQPRDRQVVAGAALGYRTDFAEIQLDYQREVDPGSHYFVSERAALAGLFRPLPRVSLTGGAEYDLAQGFWGSADASVRYFAPAWTLTAGVMRYRPHFDLWTVWGAFSPVAWHAITGSASYSGVRNLQLQVRGSRFWYEDTETETPLVNVEDRGWKLGLVATWSPLDQLSLEAGHEAEFGGGGSYASYDASVGWMPREQWTLTAHGGRLTRPLEFRFNEATLYQVGVEASWRPSDRWQFDAGVVHYMEERDRPDQAALDWNQTRMTARVRLLLGSDADQLRLPKGRRATVSGSRTP